MKTLYILVLAASMMISALFGESEAYAQDNKAGNVPGMHLLDEPNTIRVLGIGNSFKKSYHRCRSSLVISLRSRCEWLVSLLLCVWFMLPAESWETAGNRCGE